MDDRTDPRDGIVRLAAPYEREALWRLALRSKASWGYDPAFMEACADELRVPTDWIEAGNVFVVDVDEKPAGFSSLLRLSDDEVELYHLFVDPAHIGCGIGKMLFRAACKEYTGRGYSRLRIQSDPYAEGFYLRAGAYRIGEMESLSVKGRFLPLLVFDLEPTSTPSLTSIPLVLRKLPR